MTGEAGENVIDAEKEFPFGEVHDEGEASACRWVGGKSPLR
jgi:hypothetical protein